MKSWHRLLRSGLLFLALISVGLVVRRILIIAQIIPAAPKGAKFVVETGLKDYTGLTLIHIIPGFLVVTLGPWLLMDTNRIFVEQKQIVQRCLFIAAGFLVGLSAMLMPFITLPIGGLNEAVATEVYGLVFILAVLQVMRTTIQKNKTAWRAAMIRTMSLALAIASTRLIMVLAFIIWKVSAAEFLGTAFWMAFTIHLWIAETWIKYSEAHPLRSLKRT